MGKTRESSNLVSNNNVFSDITNSRVGIGTTIPQYTLDIKGDVNFSGALYEKGDLFVASRWNTGTGNDIYRLNGDVGIGTTNPSEKLEVYNGNIFISDGVLLTDQNINTNVNIVAGKNGLLIGPVTVGVGVTIDVALGSVLVVV
jgi:hypothetical protein